MWWMLLCKRVFLLGFLVVLASAHQRCSTARPSRDDLEQTQREITRHHRRLTTATSLSLCSQCIGIDTYFHVFQRSSLPPLLGPVDSVVDAAILETQLHLLNNAFRETPFFFRLLNTTLVVNDGLHDRFDETSDALQSAAQTYRMGDYSTLNVYFGNRLGQTSFAYLPENVGNDDTDAFRIEDGVWMDMATLPTSEGGGGLTLVHEVGHWLGLLHTYEGNSCDPSNPNDYVADTPQQAFASTGCPSNPAPDTCPFLPGNDPVHNYMDLSGDECYREFTPLQIERMYILWSLYRTQQEVCNDTTQIHVVIEIRFDGFARDINWELTDGGTLLINQETEGYQTRYTMALNNDRVQHDICLPSRNDASVLYNFTIVDDFGDGLEPPGFYKLTVDGIVLAEGGDFGSAESTVFNATRSSFSPPPGNSTSFPTVQPSNLLSSSSSSAPSTTPSQSPEHLVRKPSAQPSHLRVPSTSPSESPEHLVPTPSAQPSHLRVPSTSPSESPEQTTPAALPTNGVLFEDLAPSNVPTTLTISPSFAPSEGVSPSSAPSSGQLPSVAPSESTSLLPNLDLRSAHPSGRPSTVAPTVLPPTLSPSSIEAVPSFPIPSASLMPSSMGNTAQPTDSGSCFAAGTICSQDMECCSQQCLPALGARYCFARRNPPKSTYRVGRIENRG